jgi:hypothetical protein
MGKNEKKIKINLIYFYAEGIKADSLGLHTWQSRWPWASHPIKPMAMGFYPTTCRTFGVGFFFFFSALVLFRFLV